MHTSLQEEQAIYTVSHLNALVRGLLEDEFPSVWVEGEISNFAAPHSGHWYFSLKDAGAQVRCAMFKGRQRSLDFSPKDGMHILIKARVSLYENRGEFQLLVDAMEERGEGKLRRAYEILKRKLEAAGLFDSAHKKTLPLFPQSIGVITSATGAAIRDILTVLKRRYPCAAIIIYPCLVQGEQAAPGIVKAIESANRRKECEVIILARGGGSLEDLWAFNEEIVAHAIYASEIPLISGVGHEVDFTIADFVADVRAPTPSAAAEIATPDISDILVLLEQQQNQIQRNMQSQLTQLKQQLSWMHTHLSQQHPKRKILEKMQSLDYFELQLSQLMRQLLQNNQAKLQKLSNSLNQVQPLHRIQQLQQQLQLSKQQLLNQLQQFLQRCKTQIAHSAATLEAISPLATLTRGYALLETKDHKLIKDIKMIKKGDALTLRLQQGKLQCLVEEVEILI